MKESHRKGVANHPDPEPCGGGGNGAPEALDRGRCRLGIPEVDELRNHHIRVLTVSDGPEGNTAARDIASAQRHGGVEDPMHAPKLHAREPRDPVALRAASSIIPVGRTVLPSGCVGINRRGVVNERVTQERSSEPS